MRVKANAKINVGLNVLKQRKDGFHEIESVFFPIDLYDELEIKSAKKDSFSTNGLEIPASKHGNLCLQAVNLLRKDFDFPPLHIHLKKIIPIGAGLGGGSSDAVFVLKQINRQFDLKLSTTKLKDYATRLGSDCTFFVPNKAALVKGVGNQIFPDKKYDVLKSYHLLLVKPDIFVSTKKAYENIMLRKPSLSLKDLIQQPIDKWQENLRNDFEKSVFTHHPELHHIKSQLYKAGALFAAMSGSGATIFGVFENKRVDTKVFSEHWWRWSKTI